MRYNKLPPLVTIFFMGLSSGINYATLGATLTVFFSEMNLAYWILGVLSLRMMPYSLKGLISPLTDIIPMRLFPFGFGHRRGWAIFMLSLLSILFLAFSLIDKSKEKLEFLLSLSVFAAFLAAGFDNILHGYRIENFSDKEQAKSNTIVALSFKIGFFYALSLGLVVSEYFSWDMFFYLVSASYLLSIIVFVLSTEKKIIIKNLGFLQNFKQAKKNYLIPFFALFSKKNAFLVIVIAMFFKASDTFMDTLLVPYLLEMGFSKTQTVGYSKFIGFLSYSIGTIFGGVLLYKKFNLFKTMVFVEMMSALSNLGFIVFQYQNSSFLLSIVSFAESISSSMCNVVLITFLSSFCKSTLRFTATFFSILQSLSLLNRFVFSSFSGIVVEKMGWTSFLMVSSALSIPAILACLFLLNKSKNSEIFDKEKVVN